MTTPELEPVPLSASVTPSVLDETSPHFPRERSELVGCGWGALEQRWDIGFVAVLGYIVVEYAFLPIAYPILQPLALGKVTVVTAMLFWLLSPHADPRVSTTTRSIDTLLFLVVGAALLSIPGCEYEGLAWSAFIDVLRWAMIYFVISRLITNSWRIRVFCAVWVIMNFKLAQSVVRQYGHWSSMPGANSLELMTFGFGGGSNFFGNSADLGVAMCVAWPITLSLALAKPQRSLYRWLLFICSVVMLLAILFCGSRGAVVGAVILALVYFLRSPKNLAGFLALIIVASALWVLLPTGMRQRFESARTPEKDLTARHRLLLWKAGWRMFQDHPLTGVGISNFAKVRRDHYRIEDVWDKTASVPHSLYIETLSETGILGSFAMLGLWLSFLRLNYKTRRILSSLSIAHRRSFEYCLATSLDLALVGYLASGAFVAVLWYPHIFVLLGISVALHRGAEQLRQVSLIPIGAEFEREYGRETECGVT